MRAAQVLLQGPLEPMCHASGLAWYCLSGNCPSYLHMEFFHHCCLSDPSPTKRLALPTIHPPLRKKVFLQYTSKG